LQICSGDPAFTQLRVGDSFKGFPEYLGADAGRIKDVGSSVSKTYAAIGTTARGATAWREHEARAAHRVATQGGASAAGATEFAARACPM